MSKDPKIVFMGTKRKDGGDDDLFAMMQEIDATRIPTDLLYGLYLQSDDKDTLQIDTSKIDSEFISFEMITNYLQRRQLYDSAVRIEVVVDTEKAGKYLETISSEFLHKLFESKE